MIVNTSTPVVLIITTVVVLITTVVLIITTVILIITTVILIITTVVLTFQKTRKAWIGCFCWVVRWFVILSAARNLRLIKKKLVRSIKIKHSIK